MYQRNSSSIPALYWNHAGVIENFSGNSAGIPVVPVVPAKFQKNSVVPMEFCWSYRKFQGNSAKIPVVQVVPEKFQKNSVVPLEFRGNSAELAESFFNG